MNSRSDDHELPPSSSRVSARSRFSAPTYDFGTNDNYRATTTTPTVSKSKGGINGRSYEDDDDDDEAIAGLSSRSAIRSAAKRRENKLEDDFSLSRQRSSGSTASSSSTKDRPWRTAASAGSSSTNSASSYATAHDHDNIEVSTSSSNRWAQYETDDLAEESRRATSNAVVDMATKLANRQGQEDADLDEEEEEPMIPSAPMGGNIGTGYRDDPAALQPPAMPNTNSPGRSNGASSRSTTDYVKSRFSSLVTSQRSNSAYERNMLSTSSTQSDHDKVRNEALKMLQIADDCLSPSRNSAPNSPRSSINATTGLFRTRGGGLAMRELDNDEMSNIRVTSSEKKKREKASALAGLDKFGSPERTKSPRFDGTFTIGSQDEEDLKNFNASPNEDTPTMWSSRYSVEHQLMAITGGLDSKHLLNKMDMLHSSRDKTKSARGLYRASNYALDGSHEEYNDYNSSSSMNLGLWGSTVWTWLRGTLWSDDLELNHDGTTQSLVRREKAMQRRKRIRWTLAFVIGLCIAVGVLVEMGNTKASTALSPGDVNFYVLADEPYDFSNVEQLTRELEALPKEADFVIHLGNANGDEQSRCQEYGFERAAAILKESPVPMLVIPGDLDWAACGSKKKAQKSLQYWDINLGQLEKNWEHGLHVEYSDDVVGNFAFLHKGVLFISVSIVDVETRPDEVTARLEQNVMWTKSQLNKHEDDEYHAVVIFGHAPPSSKQGEYFWPVIEQIKDLKKPVLYVHANSNGSFEQYTPYNEASNFKAVQLEKRGREAPMRVVVMDKKKNEREESDIDPFVFERRSPTRMQK